MAISYTDDNFIVYSIGDKVKRIVCNESWDNECAIFKVDRHQEFTVRKLTRSFHFAEDLVEFEEMKGLPHKADKFERV